MINESPGKDRNTRVCRMQPYSNQKRIIYSLGINKLKLIWVESSFKFSGVSEENLQVLGLGE